MRKLMLIFVGVVILAQISFAQQMDEKEGITKTVTLYFEGMVERNKAKLEEAFIQESRLIGYRGENFTITSFESWAEGTSIGTPRNPEDYINKIVSIRVQGNTAVAETELFWPGVYYYDFLTLVKIDGKWKIVNKSWYEKKL